MKKVNNPTSPITNLSEDSNHEKTGTKNSFFKKITEHLFEIFVVYGIVLFVIGILKVCLYSIYKNYDYLIIGSFFIIGTFIIWLISKKKERNIGLKIKREMELLRIAKWRFLLEKDDAEQKAILDLFNVAKIKGLYDGISLESEIKNYFVDSSKVKIKVTRGYNLFIDDGTSSEKDIFHHCINEIGKDKERDIELLLHFPCLKSEHTIKRATANRITPEQYIKSLLQVIFEIKKITKSTTNKNEISVRFYNDYEIKWRYYLFVNAKNSDKTLFLNYYDDKKSGADSAMLKIEFGSGTLCQDFDAKFDEIFTNSKHSKEIVSNLKANNELMTQKFCEHPDCAKKIKDFYSEVFYLA